MDVTYAVETDLNPAEFIDILRRSGLDARRPADQPERIRRMVENANLTITARDADGRLVGVARSLTDFAYICYLSDLAVDREVQHRGIGRELMQRTHAAAGRAENTLVLLSAPEAMEYYPKTGFRRFENAFGIGREH